MAETPYFGLPHVRLLSEGPCTTQHHLMSRIDAPTVIAVIDKMKMVMLNLTWSRGSRKCQDAIRSIAHRVSWISSLVGFGSALGGGFQDMFAGTNLLLIV